MLKHHDGAGVLLLMALLLAGSAVDAATTEVRSRSGDTITIDAESTYTLGDSDSRVDARAVAIEQARARAAERAGTWVVSRTELRDGEVTREQIRTLSAGFITTRVLDETFEVVDGQGRLTVQLRAELDRAGLDERLEELAGDPQLRQRLSRLEEENGTLRRRLERITDDLRQGRTEEAALRERRARVIEELNDNRNSVRASVSGGSLLDLAEDQDQELEAIRDEMLTAFWEPVMDAVELKVASLRVEEDGGRADVHVIVELNYAQFRINSARKWASEWMESSSMPFDETPLRYSEYSNTGGEGPSRYAEPLFRDLQKARLRVRADLGDRSKHQPILESETGNRFLREPDRLKFVFRDVPRQELATLDGVDLETVLRTD